VRNMSRGMRQKLGLVLALAHRPRVLVLDEPTNSLDPLMQDQLKAHLRALAQAGHTIFFSSHTLSEVEQLCDRLAILRDGRIVLQEALHSLRDRSRRDIVIEWSDPAGAAQAPPTFLRILEHDARTWAGMLAGPVPDLLQWAAQQPIADLSIGRPDLEALFRRYYHEEEEEGM